MLQGYVPTGLPSESLKWKSIVKVKFYYTTKIPKKRNKILGGGWIHNPSSRRIKTESMDIFIIISNIKGGEIELCIVYYLL